MKVYVCTDHDTHYPVGGASVVIARTKPAAKIMLDRKLESVGLKTSKEKPYTLKELLLEPGACILNDGNY